MTSRGEWMRHVYLPRSVATWGPRTLGTLTPPNTGNAPQLWLLFQDSFSTHCDIITVRPALQTSYCRLWCRNTQCKRTHFRFTDKPALLEIWARPVSARFMSHYIVTLGEPPFMNLNYGTSLVSCQSIVVNELPIQLNNITNTTQSM